jgi:hypothetical protein
MTRTGAVRAAGARRARPVRVLRDEAEEGKQGELRDVGHRVGALAGTFVLGTVLGRGERKKGGLLVVEAFRAGLPVR